jgi:polyketide biosynthesis 3-hydroxy-3-methylglutaryl-CoA synthase-like enzyme PksG
MQTAGIEAINVFGGSVYVDVAELAAHRQLEHARFANLLMKEKATALPHEDPVTCAANAARPIVDSLSAAQRERVELLIVCTESGIDFGKSIGSYVHQQLGLNRNCRQFELKQACYSGTAGLQMALCFVLANTSPGAKALVIATDVSRFIVAPGGSALSQDWSYAEPSSGAGAVAFLVGAGPAVFQADIGANGYYGYEVMDTCRPAPDSEAGDTDLSLLSYLDCCEQSFLEYQRRVAGADYRRTFQYLAFHTPFGGMVKGAHRTMMRKLAKAAPDEIEADFSRRIAPGLEYCQRVGNIMGGTVLLALASTVDHGSFATPQRVGCFSYGSGCCSEFYSGVVSAESQTRQRRFDIAGQLNGRQRLGMPEYEELLRVSGLVRFGTRNVKVSDSIVVPPKPDPGDRPRLLLREIKEYHREYEWTR